jgi:hypothetical protein
MMFVMRSCLNLVVLVVVSAALTGLPGCTKQPQPTSPESRKQQLKNLQDELNKERQ